MAQEEIIKQFEAQQVRVVWDDEQEKYFFSIVDVIRVLTESADYQTSRKYWNKVKQRLVEEGNESVTNCHQLRMTAADGKQFAFLTDLMSKVWSGLSCHNSKKSILQSLNS